MPLKIESGSYEVNRRRPDTGGRGGSAPIKKLSKFTLWRHWRRSVHEERGSSEERRSAGAASSSEILLGGSAGGGAGEPGSAARREVAGLTAPRPDSPGASLPRTSRRSRPHSLAVQPLNYQRLDPDRLDDCQAQQRQPAQQRQTTAHAATNRKPAAGKHPSMTSQESIGSCSLDVEKSAASDRSDLNAGSLSEKTLHSLALSTCNGESLSTAGEQQQQQQQPATAIRVIGCQGEENDSTGVLGLSNGHGPAANTEQQQQQQVASASAADEETDDEPQQLTSSKKPSYLGLACSISGYSGITRYDSKLREGFRSRDSSPGARLIQQRDTSPAAFRPNDTTSSLSPQPSNPAKSHQPQQSSISPLAMKPQRNGLTNGVHEKTGAGRLSSEGYSEVDRAGLGMSDPLLSPVRGASPNRKDGGPVAARIASYNSQNKSATVTASSPKLHPVNVPSPASKSDTSILNGSASNHSGNYSLRDVDSSSGLSYLENSFVASRVQRLYGPGALAQGFFTKRHVIRHVSSTTAVSPQSRASVNVQQTSTDEQQQQQHTVNDEESLKSFPVLRHLTPEFRAQLPVASPRRPTDGTEQVIKPLKRISLSPEKNDAKEIKESPVKQDRSKVAANTKMTASTTSSKDQQSATPKVVMPVQELHEDLKNVSKPETEVSKDVEDKDGHYYLGLLNKEKNRLISFTEQAEKELENSETLGIPEEVAGKLRSVIGKTRLLARERMWQFEGLCTKNINKVPGEQFPTTSEDLAGFWDMIMIQIDEVGKQYEAIECLRKSQWKEVPDTPIREQKSTPSTPQNGSATKRRQTPASKAKSIVDSEAARKRSEAREQTRRQLIEERRRAMRLKTAAKQSENGVEIFVPET